MAVLCIALQCMSTRPARTGAAAPGGLDPDGRRPVARGPSAYRRELDLHVYRRAADGHGNHLLPIPGRLDPEVVRPRQEDPLVAPEQGFGGPGDLLHGERDLV